MEPCFALREKALHLFIRAVPGSSKTELKEIREGRLRIRIAAAPENNRANEELRSFLAKTLGCSKKDVLLLSGETSRLKTIGLPLALKERLEELCRPLLKGEL